MSEMHTHYDNLKVSRGAPAEVIRAAYRALSQRYHPDKNPSPDAARIMRILNDAYAVLSDPEQRRTYDAWLARQEGKEFASSDLDSPSRSEHSPVQSPSTADRSKPSSAGRWDRFFARTFDLWWQLVLLGAATAYLLGSYWPGYVDWMVSPGGASLLGIAVMPLALALDVIVAHLFGNTPGKALLGLRVTTSQRTRLTLNQRFERNTGVWMKGLAFGVPLVGLVTMGNQALRLGQGRQASYDEVSGFTVETAKTGILRRLAFCVALLTLLSMSRWMGGPQKPIDAGSVQADTAPTVRWVNPETNMTADIDPEWSVSSSMDGGKPVYNFAEKSGRATVDFAEQTAPGYSLSQYASFAKGNFQARVRFSNEGWSDNGRYWEADGVPVSRPDARFHISVTQVGSTFWRIVEVRTTPYAVSEELLVRLRKELWATIS